MQRIEIGPRDQASNPGLEIGPRCLSRASKQRLKIGPRYESLRIRMIFPFLSHAFHIRIRIHIQLTVTLRQSESTSQLTNFGPTTFEIEMFLTANFQGPIEIEIRKDLSPGE